MSSKLLAAAVVAVLGSPALAQYGTTPPPTPPPAYPPAAAPPSAPSQYGQQPSQYGQQPSQYPQQPSQYPQQPAATAPAQQPATTAPPATSGASQQVVVNPPAGAPAAPPAQAPAQTAPSSAPAQVTVNPPAQAPAPSTVIVDRGERRAQTVVVGDETRSQRNPMAVVATNALYGGAAGAVVGVGVALIEGGNWARDVTVGAGLGVLAGAVVGGITAYGDQGGDRIARDGLGTPARDKDKQRPLTPVAGYAFAW